MEEDFLRPVHPISFFAHYTGPFLFCLEAHPRQNLSRAATSFLRANPTELRNAPCQHLSGAAHVRGQNMPSYSKRRRGIVWASCEECSMKGGFRGGCGLEYIQNKEGHKR